MSRIVCNCGKDGCDCYDRWAADWKAGRGSIRNHPIQWRVDDAGNVLDFMPTRALGNSAEGGSLTE